MSTAVLKLHYQTIQQKISSAHLFNIPWKLIYIFAGLAAGVLLISYIVMVNQLIQGTYLIKNDTKMLQNLMAENRTLQTQFAQSNFLGKTQYKAEELGFEKTKNVTYVRLLQNTLAAAK